MKTTGAVRGRGALRPHRRQGSFLVLLRFGCVRGGLDLDGVGLDWERPHHPPTYLPQPNPTTTPNSTDALQRGRRARAGQARALRRCLRPRAGGRAPGLEGALLVLLVVCFVCMGGWVDVGIYTRTHT
jgi:hypothetical protein